MPRVIVIGSSRGIGQELVRQYAVDGWQVLATARTAADLAQFDGVRGLTTAIADTSDEASLKALAQAAGEPYDLLIVNAGTNNDEGGLSGVEAAEWIRVMTVNALGPVLAIRALSGKVRDGGTIVALSSTLGSIGANSGGGMYSYRMSKAALNMGLMNLGHDLKRRQIGVAALHPGWVKTAMGGAGAPVEIVDSVTGLRKVIAGLPTGKAARFIDYQGNQLAW